MHGFYVLKKAWEVAVDGGFQLSTNYRLWLIQPYKTLVFPSFRPVTRFSRCRRLVTGRIHSLLTNPALRSL
jgi:hypothetical protein